MKNKSIKIAFNTAPVDGAVAFEEYEKKVVNAIKAHDKLSIKVFIKNGMSLTEFDKIVFELCELIKQNFSCETKIFHNNECIAADTRDVILSVIYYIEMSIDNTTYDRKNF